MKHFSPATIAAPKTKYLHCALTGRVIASRSLGVSPFDGSWIKEAIASEYEVPTDEIECVETDDGEEFFVIDGERVAFVAVN